MRLRWKDFEFPNRVFSESDSARRDYAKFVVEPFERGFGHTIGNSLRRILLSSLEGAAVTSVRIEGVNHEFTAIPGVLEDMTEIVLNIKKIRVRLDSRETKSLKIRVKGNKGSERVVTAGDIEDEGTVEVLNKDLLICTLTDDVDFNMEMNVAIGRGYSLVEQNLDTADAIGVIALASSYSPVTRVRYNVSETRVGQMTNYDKLEMEVWTDGSISPEMALVEAAKILRKHLNPFVQYGEIGKTIYSDAQMKSDVKNMQRQEDEFRLFLQMPISSLGLSVRCANCLDSESIHTMDELLQKTESYLLTVKNFGKTSLDEINEKLQEHGERLGREIHLGLDISEYASSV
jgi:DNA-directed RNA polymerase subunit alpha